MIMTSYPYTSTVRFIFNIMSKEFDLILFICRILPVDLSDPDATRAATEEAKELFGQIDILINNAGTYIACSSNVHMNVIGATH